MHTDDIEDDVTDIHLHMKTILSHFNAGIFWSSLIWRIIIYMTSFPPSLQWIVIEIIGTIWSYDCRECGSHCVLWENSPTWEYHFSSFHQIFRFFLILKLTCYFCLATHNSFHILCNRYFKLYLLFQLQ